MSTPELDPAAPAPPPSPHRLDTVASQEAPVPERLEPEPVDDDRYPDDIDLPEAPTDSDDPDAPPMRADEDDTPPKLKYDPESLRLARAEAERRWPDLATDADREEWVQVHAGKAKHLDIKQFEALGRKLDAKQAAAAPASTPGYDQMLAHQRDVHPLGGESDRVLVARWLSGDHDVDSAAGSAALSRLQAANPDRPDDVALSEPSATTNDLDGDSEESPLGFPDEPSEEEQIAAWFDFLYGVFGITGYPPAPHSEASAANLIDQCFPGAPDNYRTAFIHALMGAVAVRVEDGRGEVELTAERIERWSHEARAEVDLARRVDEIAEARVRENLPNVEAHVRDKLAADLEPWHRTGAGIFVIVAVALGVLVFVAMGIMDQVDQRSYQARLDKAAADVPMFYNTEGQLDDADNMTELREKTGFSEDEAVREVQMLTGLSSHEARLTVLEREKSGESMRADREAGRADLAEVQRDALQAERALDKEQLDAATAAASDAEAQARRAGLRADRAEAAATQAAASVRDSERRSARLATDVVRGGDCRRVPGDFLSSSGQVQSQWTCGNATIQCDGNDVSQVTNCVGLSR